jgi:hypothetical protein
MPKTLAFGRLRQGDHEFQASLKYIARLSQKITTARYSGSHLYS